jgi:hypothetical protein
MKKVCLVFAAISVYLISCSSSKDAVCLKEDKDYFKDPFVNQYKNDSNFILPSQACRFIHEFKKHKYKVFGKNKLTNTWSYFNPRLVDSLASDKRTDSVIFLMAAFPKNKSIINEKRGHPFVIMEIVQKPTMTADGKGGSNLSVTSNPSLFFTATTICPPPNTGCRIPGTS